MMSHLCTKVQKRIAAIKQADYMRKKQTNKLQEKNKDMLAVLNNMMIIKLSSLFKFLLYYKYSGIVRLFLIHEQR